MQIMPTTAQVLFDRRRARSKRRRVRSQNKCVRSKSKRVRRKSRCVMRSRHKRKQCRSTQSRDRFVKSAEGGAPTERERTFFIFFDWDIPVSTLTLGDFMPYLLMFKFLTFEKKRVCFLMKCAHTNKNRFAQRGIGLYQKETQRTGYYSHPEFVTEAFKGILEVGHSTGTEDGVSTTGSTGVGNNDGATVDFPAIIRHQEEKMVSQCLQSIIDSVDNPVWSITATYLPIITHASLMIDLQLCTIYRYGVIFNVTNPLLYKEVGAKEVEFSQESIKQLNENRIISKKDLFFPVLNVGTLMEIN